MKLFCFLEASVDLCKALPLFNFINNLFENENKQHVTLEKQFNFFEIKMKVFSV